MVWRSGGWAVSGSVGWMSVAQWPWRKGVCVNFLVAFFQNRAQMYRIRPAFIEP